MSKRCPNIDSRICANCSYRDTCNVQSGEQLVSWGNVSGDINKQTDLRNMMDELRTAIRQEVLSMKQEALLDNRDRISKLQSLLEKRFDDGFAGMLDRIDRAKEDTRLSLLSSLPKFRWNGTRLFLANDGVSYDDGIELKGEQGRAAFTSIVFKAGNDNGLIVAPTGGTFDSPVPAGWSDGIPERTANNPTIYMSKRKFTSDGVGQDSEWSTPVVAYDSQYTDICFHPATQSGATPQAPTRHGSQGDVISTWHDTGNSDDVWMAISYRDMRSNGWSDWSISKIKGENGDTPEFQIDESSGMLQYRFKDNPFSNLAKVVGDNGKTPALKWEGTKLYIASDGENFDNGVELKGANGKTPTFQINGKTLQYKFEEDDTYQSLGTVVGADGARGTRWFTVPQDSFDYSSTNSTSNILFSNILEVQSGIATSSDIQVGDKVKMSVLGYTAEVISVITQEIVVMYDGGKIRGAQGEQGAAGSDGMSMDYVGDWAAGNKYIVGDVVVYYYKTVKLNNDEFANTNLYEYICIADNTSSESDFKEYQTDTGFNPSAATIVKKLDTTKWKLSRKQSNTLRGITTSLPLT